MKISQKLSFPLAVLAISNAVTGLTQQEPFLGYLGYVSIFIGIATVLFVANKEIPRLYISLICIIFSIIMEFHLGCLDLTGFCLFLTASCLVWENKKIIIFYFIILVSIAVFGFNRSAVLTSQFIAFSSGALFLFVIYHHYFYNPLAKKKHTDKIISKELLDDENMIIYLLSCGLSQKCAGAEMGITQSEASEVVKRIKRKTGEQSLYRIMFIMGQQFNKKSPDL